jgi:hypothetical protein
VTRDDAIRPYTRVVAAIVLPFLVVAWVLLYLLPNDTDTLFAWTIVPSLTSMLLAAAYAGGVWFFVSVLRARRWHRVKYGFPAVLVFAALLATATVLHWDRFHSGHVSFVTWAALYFTTPVLVAVAIALNWRADPATADERDYRIPLAPRLVVSAVGTVSLVCGLAIFVAPGLVAGVWAWELTPLTARVVGAVLTLPGVVNLWLLADSRWSAFRSIFQAQIVSLVFITGALVLARGDLAPSGLAAPAFVLGIVVSLVAFTAFYLWCERRSARAGSAVGE